MATETDLISVPMQTTADYLVAARDRELPEEVTLKTCQHILDTVAAIVTGARLEPGRLGIAYARSQGGTEEAQVIGTDFLTNATSAALTNGISAHADETDDSHAPSFSHPGCAVVPAALAIAERHGRSGTDLVRAVSAGYDVGCRITPMLGMSEFATHGASRSSHAMVSVWGAAAAAATLEDLTSEQVRWVLSYTAQQSSGVTTWLRDERHVEKAFVFAGMGARNGVASATMVAAGFDGVADVFSGHPNYLEALSPVAELDVLSADLGERYEVIRTNIKKYAVGSPAQAAIQATEDLISLEGLTADQVERLEIHLPDDLAEIVDNRHMPDINCQYLVAGTLLDGRFSFVMAHDTERMQAEDVQALTARMDLIPDDTTRGTRKGRVIVHRRDGTRCERFVEAVEGTAENPMQPDAVIDKCRDLLDPILGKSDAKRLITLLLEPDRIGDVRELRPLLAV